MDAPLSQTRAILRKSLTNIEYKLLIGRGGGIRRLASVVRHLSEFTILLSQLAETRGFSRSLWLLLLSIESSLGNQFPQKSGIHGIRIFAPGSLFDAVSG
jgi:hypothetical protein